MNQPVISQDRTPDTELLAIHLVKHLTSCQIEGRVVTLADLVDELGVRRTDLRALISRLHAEGHVDALRLRPTMSGFTLGVAAMASGLRALREESTPVATPLTRAA